jgi:hypothetical protein
MDVFQTVVCQIVIGSLMDVPLCFYPVVIGQTIHFMDEHFKLNVGVDSEGFGDCGVEFGEGICVFILQGEPIIKHY